jgi:hypothetical protein
MSGDFMSILQNLVPEVIPSQKCQILSGYGGQGKKGKAVPLHAMKAPGVRGGIAPTRS